MYNKILVPLDGSEMSECSLEHVRQIALGCRVPEVVLLTVVEPIEAGAYASELSGAGIVYSTDRVNEIKKELDNNYQNAMKAAGEYLEQMAKELRAQGMNVNKLVLQGKAAETILDYAAKNGVDLIIMGTHGWGGKARWDFGHVVDRIIRTSNIPLVAASPKGCRV